MKAMVRKAMVRERPGTPLREVEREPPVPGPGQVLPRVRACGACRTDLHVVDCELPWLGRPIRGAAVLAVGS